MISRHLFHGPRLVVFFVLLVSHLVLAQGTPLTVGPLTVTVPAGWTKPTGFGHDQNQFFSPDSTPLQYFKVEFEPAEQTSQDLQQRHATIVGNLAGMMKPGSTPQNGVTGK